MILVTGGAGFIGKHFIRDWLAHSNEPVLNLDQLTYASSLALLDSSTQDSRHIFVKGDIADRELLDRLLAQYQPRAIINFAAETHVDRSIHEPSPFMHSNVMGVFHLLEAVRCYLAGCKKADADQFRFLHISTDEVFGPLNVDEPAFTESSRYNPSSPYSASKASADHLVRAYHRTYKVPTLITHCSNNYGPHQFPEKLIPFMLRMALSDKKLPLYGDGLQHRDWLHVQDHCSALRLILERGALGESYNIGANNEWSNLALVEEVCALLDKHKPRADSKSYKTQIEFVADRPGHDRRYGLDCSKLKQQLGWQASMNFKTGLELTVNWFLEHPEYLGVQSE